MCHCGQLLFLSSNDRPVQSLDLAASSFAVRHLEKEALSNQAGSGRLEGGCLETRLVKRDKIMHCGRSELSHPAADR